jgi:hypothetical protein
MAVTPLADTQAAYDGIKTWFSQDDVVLGKRETEDDSQCWYRGNGVVGSEVRCGIGSIMPNELYNPDWDLEAGGMTIDALLNKSLQLGEYFVNVNPNFLSEVQHIHDNHSSDVESFLEQLDELADKYGLKHSNNKEA